MKRILLTLCLILSSSLSMGYSINIKMYKLAPHGRGDFIGTVMAKDWDHGVLFTPNLRDLPPGVHGFHIHVNPSCADRGMAAGGHLDPKKTNKHLGPFNDQGHLGDLPVLIVGQNHTATQAVFAPRLTVRDIIGHSVMIHAGGDNYSDNPKPLGGGGARVACGVIK